MHIFGRLEDDPPLAPLAPVLTPDAALPETVPVDGGDLLSQRRGCRRDWWDWLCGMHAPWRSDGRTRGFR
jgi:hypothetical protein